MGNMKKISDSEREIMQVIWESDGELCVNDIFERLTDSEWKYTTVATFLTRLLKKGFLKCIKKGNQNYYYAAKNCEEYLTEQTDEFINDVYGGSASKMIACFAKNKVSKEDYAELMSILEKYEK